VPYSDGLLNKIIENRDTTEYLFQLDTLPNQHYEIKMIFKDSKDDVSKGYVVIYTFDRKYNLIKRRSKINDFESISTWKIEYK